MRRRLSAIVALVVGAATVTLAVVVAVAEFPRGLAVVGCLLLAALTAGYGVLRRGTVRVAGLTVAGLALAGAVALIVTGGAVLVDLIAVAGLLVAAAAAVAAIAVHVELPGAASPLSPVLFYNPRSGGGKAERFALADQARSRGIEPIELTAADDLEALVRDAVARGADGLAMAGGDGSQAIVAAVAAELGLPYACIPSGTRNHFALDLGVDRDDVVGALDAFVDGGERRVDLAEVNGRVFVNNVSLGLYAEAVQRTGYRDAKLRTLLDTVPDVLGPGGGDQDMRWRGPGGREHRSGVAVLVSNNRYRLGRGGFGHPPAPGRRPARRHRREWTVRGRRAGAFAAASMARVDRADLPGRLGSTAPRRHRRGGAHPRRPVALPEPAGSAACAHRARPSWRVAVGAGPRRHPGRRGRAGADRARPGPGTRGFGPARVGVDIAPRSSTVSCRAGGRGDVTRDAAGEPSPRARATPGASLLGRVSRYDRVGYRAVAQLSTPLLDRPLTRVSELADHSKPWLVVAGCLALLGGRRGRRAAVTGIAAIGAASFVVNQPIKLAGARQRPDRGSLGVPQRRWVSMPRSTSFPSGHSASAAAFAVAVGDVAPALRVPLRAAATTVAFSRIYTGVHFPSDVLVGATVGAVLGRLASRVAVSGSAGPVPPRVDGNVKDPTTCPPCSGRRSGLGAS